MKIYGISIVKNEADIIECSLTRACAWAEKIFVMDNGSSDGTWEKIKEIARVNPKIVPWRQSDEIFHDGLRAKVFNEFSNVANDGDWWCARLDADEFYIDNPKEFLQSRVESYFHVVCSKHVQYQFTDEDSVGSDPVDVGIEERLRRLKYFDKKSTSEVRFFRHRRRLKWDEHHPLPRHVGLVCPDRILVRHYQYRSLKQIQKRIQTRKVIHQKYPNIFPHVASGSVEDYIVKSTDCIYDTGEVSIYNELPLVNNKNLKYRWWVFWLRRLLHAIRIFP